MPTRRKFRRNNRNKNKSRRKRQRGGDIQYGEGETFPTGPCIKNDCLCIIEPEKKQDCKTARKTDQKKWYDFYKNKGIFTYNFGTGTVVEEELPEGYKWATNPMFTNKNKNNAKDKWTKLNEIQIKRDNKKKEAWNAEIQKLTNQQIPYTIDKIDKVEDIYDKDTKNKKALHGKFDDDYKKLSQIIVFLNGDESPPVWKTVIKNLSGESEKQEKFKKLIGDAVIDEKTKIHITIKDIRDWDGEDEKKILEDAARDEPQDITALGKKLKGMVNEQLTLNSFNEQLKKSNIGELYLNESGDFRKTFEEERDKWLAYNTTNEEIKIEGLTGDLYDEAIKKFVGDDNGGGLWSNFKTAISSKTNNFKNDIKKFKDIMTIFEYIFISNNTWNALREEGKKGGNVNSRLKKYNLTNTKIIDTFIELNKLENNEHTESKLDINGIAWIDNIIDVVEKWVITIPVENIKKHYVKELQKIGNDDNNKIHFTDTNNESMISSKFFQQVKNQFTNKKIEPYEVKAMIEFQIVRFFRKMIQSPGRMWEWCNIEDILAQKSISVEQINKSSFVHTKGKGSTSCKKKTKSGGRKTRRRRRKRKRKKTRRRRRRRR